MRAKELELMGQRLEGDKAKREAARKERSAQLNYLKALMNKLMFADTSKVINHQNFV